MGRHLQMNIIRSFRWRFLSFFSSLMASPHDSLVIIPAISMDYLERLNLNFPVSASAYNPGFLQFDLYRNDRNRVAFVSTIPLRNSARLTIRYGSIEGEGSYVPVQSTGKLQSLPPFRTLSSFTLNFAQNHSHEKDAAPDLPTGLPAAV